RLKGHTIHIITHRTFEGRGVHNTMDWLQKSGLEFDSITFSEDKTLVGVDLLLDDYEKNWKAAQDQGIECVLMSHSYNEHVTAATRVDGWVQFGQIVELVYDLF
ncbi:MAG TPA: hypothetical protein PK181_05975, partial [Methanothrix soehngenii]|nr:hypothetical protein [Methanothrix soehngenii]